MDREKAKELLPIIHAFADGKQIQFRLIDERNMEVGDWNDLPAPEMCVTFPADDYEYRIKPAPREFWLQTESTKLAITNALVRSVPPEDGEWIKVREVLDE